MMKRTAQQSMLGFLSKKTKKSEKEVTNQKNVPLECDPVPGPSKSTDTDSTDTGTILVSNLEVHDIGKYISHPPRNDEEKLKALKVPWTPPETFKFPATGKRNLSFQRSWMKKYPWLVYSNIAHGALCKMCVLFGKTEGGRGGQELGAFVTRPFNNWKKALESFNCHENAKYHNFAVEKAKNFVSVAEGQSLDVTELINVENQKIAEENRKRLTAIVETILLCGRQEMALRGKKDHGEIGIEEPADNDGNFRALLRFRANSGDESLKNHLLTQNSHNRAMYTSSKIQNELIELCGKAIQEQLIERIKKSGYFAVLADETQDISRYEQLALCVRYVDSSTSKSVIREDFLEFVHVEDVTAQALASTITENLLSFDLDLENLVGQGYDGAAVMSGRLKGVRTIISEKYPKAQFVHCVAHTLNLVLAHSCEIPMIRNCIGTIKSVINFFRQSSLRDGFLKKTADKAGIPHSTLISLCETRWTEKHTAVERFAEMFPVVLETLEAIQATGRDVATQAYQLQVAMGSSQFIVSLVILRKVFSYTANLNKALQRVNVDLSDTCSYVKTVKSTLQSIRDENEFSVLFKEAKRLSVTDIISPRITGKQTNRSNVPGETAEIYYRRNVFYPFIEHVVSEIDARFKPHEETVAGIQLLLPERTKNDNDTKEKIKKIAHTFLSENEERCVVSEYELWHKHWCARELEKPSTALEALDQCNELFFPAIKKLLQILATLPVSTATPERSFSTLKRLKTYLRNKMGDERLTGLALMSIHRDLAVKVKPSEIVHKLVVRRKRLNIIL